MAAPWTRHDTIVAQPGSNWWRLPPNAHSPESSTTGSTMSRYWSPVVHGLSPYVPGEQPRVDNLIKLNTNESPYGPSPKAVAAIRAAADDTLRLYPDPRS